MIDAMIEGFLADAAAAGDSDAPGFEDMSVEEVRSAVAGMADVCGPGLPVALVRDLTLAPDSDLTARLYHPQPGRSLPLLVFLFGGGFVAGSIDVIDTPVRQLAVLGEVAVLAVAYRLSPETPYPGPVDDAETAVRWAAAHADELGVDATRLSIGGESSGGALAAATALRLRGTGLLAAQVLVYPVLDVDFGSESYAQHADGPLLTRPAMRRFWSDYLGGEQHLAHPAAGAAPAREADLSGAPRTLIVVSEHDPLRSEGEGFALALRSAGTPTEFVRWDTMTHASWYFDRISSAAAAHNQALARSVGRLLHTPPS